MPLLPCHFILSFAAILLILPLSLPCHAMLFTKECGAARCHDIIIISLLLPYFRCLLFYIISFATYWLPLLIIDYFASFHYYARLMHYFLFSFQFSPLSLPPSFTATLLARYYISHYWSYFSLSHIDISFDISVLIFFIFRYRFHYFH
jgi:hypothetical protein